MLGLATGDALGLAAGEALAFAAGDAAGLVPGAGLCAGVAIGLAGAGFFCANSATVNRIASVIGIRATPLLLSTQPYVVRAVIVSFCAASSFSARTFARFCS
jgi:hypothetical protein